MKVRWLGVDYGEKRVGVALSDMLGLLAHPHQTLVNDKELLSALIEIVKQENVTGIVVGIPRNMNGTHGPAALKARAFGEKLMERLPELKTVFWDERMTTTEAQRRLHDAGRDVRRSRPVIDQVAAQILLQSYLDSLAWAGLQ